MEKIINKEIEIERSRLYTLQKQLGMNHPDVLIQSMKLDQLINQSQMWKSKHDVRLGLDR